MAKWSRVGRNGIQAEKRLRTATSFQTGIGRTVMKPIAPGRR